MKESRQVFLIHKDVYELTIEEGRYFTKQESVVDQSNH